MLSSKGIPSGKSYSKNLLPGNRVCKINSIVLEEDRIPNNKGAYYLQISLESEPVGADFQGFYIDNNKKELGQHLGQTGKVKNGFYSFKDGEVRGEKIFRDQLIISFLIKLATEVGVREALDAIEVATIEEYVPAASAILNNGKFMRFCIGGRQYANRNGYDAYELFLVKPSKGEVMFESIEVGEQDSKVTKYDKTNINHFKPKKEVKPVSDFSVGDSLDISSAPDDLPF